MPWYMLTVKNLKLLEMKKNIRVFLFQKYGKFLSISLDNFIKQIALISEEWITSFTHHSMLLLHSKDRKIQNKKDETFRCFLTHFSIIVV